MDHIRAKAESLTVAMRLLNLVHLFEADVIRVLARMFVNTVKSSIGKNRDKTDFWMATETAKTISDYVVILSADGARKELEQMLAEVKKTTGKLLADVPDALKDLDRWKTREDDIADIIVSMMSSLQVMPPGIFADGLGIAMAIHIVLEEKDTQPGCQEFCDYLVAGFREGGKEK